MINHKSLLFCCLLLANQAAAQQRPSAPLPKFKKMEDLPTIRAEATERSRYFDWLPFKPKPGRDNPDGWLLGPCGELPLAAKASSALRSTGKNNYQVSNLIDDDPTTAWVEGKTDEGIGESFEVILQNGYLPWRILNGYQKNPAVWEDNGRVKKFKVLINNQPVFYLLLEDKMGPQEIKIMKLLPLPKSGRNQDLQVKFVIEEVFPGRKFKDTAISAIYLGGC